jgi:hypothetical protein
MATKLHEMALNQKVKNDIIAYGVLAVKTPFRDVCFRGVKAL